jgi:transcriptional regulator with XRE-family HTH domain
MGTSSGKQNEPSLNDDGAPVRVNSETATFKETLKRLLRVQGIPYRKVAEALGVSTVTVKRYFNTDRLTVGRMEEICALLDISLTELADVVKADDEGRQRGLTQYQEDALARDRMLATVRFLLSNGWTAQEIQAEYDLDEATLVSCLVQLERLKLIDLLPGNKVRLLTARDPDWRKGGPMRRIIDEMIKRDFMTLNFAEPDAPAAYQSAELSKSSIAQVEELVRHFVRTVRTLRDADRHLPREHKEWTAVVVAMKRINWVVELDDGRTLIPKSARRRSISGQGAAESNSTTQTLPAASRDSALRQRLN